MIATHAPKMFNGRVKSPALNAKIAYSIPPYFICSQTVDMRREHFAAPVNAADIKQWREAIENLPASYIPTLSIPDISDQQIKQLLVPIDWKADSYVSVSPVASMGVIHELFHRVYEMNIPYRKWVIQPTPAAIANHGEALLLQGGAVRMLRRGFMPYPDSNWTGSFVQLTARCERMNISSGMVALGFPAMTSLGGLAHALERNTDSDIEFAFGMRSSEWISGVPKVQVHSAPRGSFSGRTTSRNVTVKPGYNTEEVTANGEVVLLLRTTGDNDMLANALRKIHRLAGGSLFDIDISVIHNGVAPSASYIIDASADIQHKCQEEGIDTLQAALDLYALDGEWDGDEWRQPRNGYTLNQTGYAYMETPTTRANVRNNYLHSWSEPLFSLVTQGSMSEAAWWSRDTGDYGASWQGNSAIRK